MKTHDLESCAGPWVHGVVPGFNLQSIPNGFASAVVREGCALTAQELMASLTTSLRFPDYFGGNFNALHDCLTDMAWLPAAGYAVVLRNSGVTTQRPMREKPLDSRTGAR